MAQHGPTQLPPPRPAPRTLLPVLPAVHGSPPPVTLHTPRPEEARAFNIYSCGPGGGESGSPISSVVQPRPAPSSGDTVKKKKTHQHHSHQENSDFTSNDCIKKPPSAVITKQPIGGAASVNGSDSDSESHERESIICERCGKCRCEACRTPRPLPHTWLCNEKCLISTETCVDWLSCMCCVKAMTYHCTSSDRGLNSADNLCTCAPHKRTLRWTGLTCMSACLPCLWCYWPLRGVAYGVQRCYQKASTHGCCCQDRDKRLLTN